MTMVTVSGKGWVVIPAELRRKYDLQAGSRVMMVDYGGVLTLVPALAHPVDEAAGLLQGGRSLTGSLLADRARERKREG